MPFPQAANRVRETTSTTGSGTFTLAGAVAGFQSFSVIGSGSSCYYSASAGSEWEVGVGTWASGLLTRDEIIDSSQGGARVNFSSGSKSVILTSIAHAVWNGFEVPGGRLTLSSTLSVPTSDLTDQTTLYYLPHRHGGIKLWTGTCWRWYSFSSLSTSLSSISAGRCYDVFAYVLNGEPALELVAWNDQSSGSITGATNATPIVITSNGHGLSNDDIVIISGVGGNTAANGTFRVASSATNTFALNTLAGASVAGSGSYTSGGTWRKLNQTTSRASAISMVDGAWVLSSDKTRLLLGTIRGSASGACTDSTSRRLVSNAYHPARRIVQAQDTTDSWSLTATSPRPANNTLVSGTSRVEMVSCLGTSLVSLHNLGYGSHGSAYIQFGIGADSISVNSAQAASSITALAIGHLGALYLGAPAVGYHYFQALERVSSGTGTVYGDNGGTSSQSGLAGEVEA